MLKTEHAKGQVHQPFLLKVLCDYLLALRVKSNLLNKSSQVFVRAPWPLSIPVSPPCSPRALATPNFLREPWLLGLGRCCSLCLLYSPPPPALPILLSPVCLLSSTHFPGHPPGEGRCPCSGPLHAPSLPAQGCLRCESVLGSLSQSDCHHREGGDGVCLLHTAPTWQCVRQIRDFLEKNFIKVFIV